MILINPTTKSTLLGDDNLWLWIERTLNTAYYNGTISDTDVLINSSYHKNSHNGDRIINLHLELIKEIYDKYPNMGGYKDTVHNIIENCNKSKITVIPSKLMFNYSSVCKRLEFIPIGVDLSMFKNLDRKYELREKYNIPQNKRIGFWSGSSYIWRGFDDLKKYINTNSDVFWIFNYYHNMKIKFPKNSKVFYRINQETINELYNASDFYLCTNQLGPYYMSDLEAIASELQIIDTTELKREFGRTPNRNKLIRAGFDRKEVSEDWRTILDVYFNM